MKDGEELVITLQPRASQNFVETEFVQEIIDRALIYIKAGFPIHLRGVSGTGKTTLAFRIAQSLGRPVMLIHGDEELKTGDLIGREKGVSIKKVRDNFIHSVLKINEDLDEQWCDNRLTLAIKNGFTLIYDEFTRSRPEANNVLLSVLQEGLLSIPIGRSGSLQYIKVHPEFTAILTSNPEEYAGVHRSQDALRDRMITMDMQPFDEITEVGIVSAKADLPKKEVEKIVKIVRYLRESGQYEFSPTIRASIMIAKSIKTSGKCELPLSSEDKVFRRICFDILGSETSRSGSQRSCEKVQKVVNAAMDKYVSPISSKVVLEEGVSA